MFVGLSVPAASVASYFRYRQILQCLDASPLRRKLRLPVMLYAQLLTLFIDDLSGRISDELLVAKLGLDPSNLLRYLGQFFIQAL